MKSTRGNLIYLIFIVFVASLGGFLFGYDTGVISGCNDLLTEQFTLTKPVLGFVDASAILGCIVGAIVAGWLADHFGRKPVLVISAVLFFYAAFGSMLPEWALGGLKLGGEGNQSTIHLLIFARFTGGIGVGIASMISPLYLAEISPPKIRGALVAYYQLAITLGMLSSYFANAIIHKYASSVVWPEGTMQQFFPFILSETWRAMFGAGMIPAFIFFLLVFFAPESPRWLCLKGLLDRAGKTLIKINGKEVANQEIVAIQKSFAEEKGSFSELLTPKLFVALVIGFLLPIIGQFSGINAILYYGPTIFKNIGMETRMSLNGQAFLGIVNFLCTFIAIAAVDRVGRRPLIFWGTLGLILSLIWAGINALSGVTGVYLVMLPFVLFIACFAFSLGPLPWIVISEIFPPRIRGQAMSVGVFAVWMGCYLVTQFFPILDENIGQGYTFFIFAFLVSSAIPLVVFLIPETKGKSLEEIQEYWENRGRK